MCVWLYVGSYSLPQVPEMLRTPLEELCLNIKLLEYNGCLALVRNGGELDDDASSVASNTESSISTFLSKAVQPPDERSVRTAIDLLHTIGALNTDDADEEVLTPLGLRLAELPMDPRLGKMILYAVLFKCLDPVRCVAMLLAPHVCCAERPASSLTCCTRGLGLMGAPGVDHGRHDGIPRSVCAAHAPRPSGPGRPCQGCVRTRRAQRPLRAARCL